LEENRDRPVIDDLDSHLSAKDPGLRGHAEGSQRMDECFNERLSLLRECSLDVARASSLPGIRKKRKLRDDKRFSMDISHGMVKFAFFVIENAEMGAFFRKPFSLSKGISSLNTQQDDQTLRDSRYLLTLNCHTSGRYPLNHCFHPLYPLLLLE
jgi:hypothetical protein